MTSLQYVVLVWLNSDRDEDGKQEGRAIKNKIVCKGLKQANDVATALNMVGDDNRAEVMAQFYLPRNGNCVVPIDALAACVSEMTRALEQHRKDVASLMPKFRAAE